MAELDIFFPSFLFVLLATWSFLVLDPISLPTTQTFILFRPPRHGWNDEDYLISATPISLFFFFLPIVSQFWFIFLQVLLVSAPFSSLSIPFTALFNFPTQLFKPLMFSIWFESFEFSFSDFQIFFFSFVSFLGRTRNLWGRFYCFVYLLC